MSDSNAKKQKVSLDGDKAAHDLKVRSGFALSASGTNAVPNGESVMPLTGKVANLGLDQVKVRKYLSGSNLKRRPKGPKKPLVAK